VKYDHSNNFRSKCDKSLQTKLAAEVRLAEEQYLQEGQTLKKRLWYAMQELDSKS
jgi:hypothetical protein